jgi:hypothetical protein
MMTIENEAFSVVDLSTICGDDNEDDDDETITECEPKCTLVSHEVLRLFFIAKSLKNDMRIIGRK